VKDEEYLFYSDARDKKNIARSARNQRTHNGKRGRVKLPSDYLTKKELKAMNGAVESYKLNNPMTWAEFKRMPDDLKESYIKLLRKRYNVPDSQIAEMLGVHKVTLCNFFKTMGLAKGGKRSGTENWDKEGWLAWTQDITVTAEANEDNQEAETCTQEDEVAEAIHEECEEPVCEAVAEVVQAVPVGGELTFEGSAETALKTVISLLGTANVKLSVKWEMLDE
jgi:hypothetical protein